MVAVWENWYGKIKSKSRNKNKNKSSNNFACECVSVYVVRVLGCDDHNELTTTYAFDDFVRFTFVGPLFSFFGSRLHV